MRRRLLLALSAAVLVATLVPSSRAEPGQVAYSPGGPASAFSTAPAGPIARTGSLTSRPSGMPSTAVPARQLRSAAVQQRLTDGRLTGMFVLGGTPGGGTEADLHVSFGSLAGNACNADVDLVTPTAGSPASGFSRAGGTIELNTDDINAAGFAEWDCAFAALTASGQPPTQATTYDVLIGPLEDVSGKPKLQIENVELLRSKVKQLRLVPNVARNVAVTVKNSGTADARGVRVAGVGKGLETKAASLGSIGAGDDSSGEVRVKLTAKSKRTLKLVAGSGAAKVTRRIAVFPARRPPRPVPGEYRSRDGSVTFRVENGRVVGWRGRMQTRCGGFPDIPTTTFNTYDFPRTKIGRDGVVDARDRGELFGVRLQLRLAGRKATKGHFSYSGPNRCFASTTFSAKRKGR